MRAPLIAAIITAVLALTDCTPVAPPQPVPQHDAPERGSGDHGGGMM